MAGGIQINTVQTLGSSVNGSASIDATARIGTASGTTSVTVTNGDLTLNGNGNTSSISADGAVITLDNHVSIGGSQTSLVAGNDILIDSVLYNADLPTGGALSLQAGQDINFRNNVGSSTNRFNHDISAIAGNNINIGDVDNVSLYLASNSLFLHADSNGSNSHDNNGDINLVSQSPAINKGHILIDTQGLIQLQANGMNIIGGQATDGSAHITTTGTINADIGSGGISIKGGNAFASSSDSFNVSAGMHANGNVSINITSGSLNITGGTATASIDSLSSSFATATASAGITAQGNIDISVNQGSVNVSGGSASASIQAMDSSGLIADANANAFISTGTTGTLAIDASQITINGGDATANAFDGSSIGASSAIAFATANSFISSNDIIITSQDTISIRGGSATAFAAASSSGTGIGSASAYARLSADNNITINQKGTGNITITGGSAIAAAMYSDASFSGTGNAFALAPAEITAKQTLAINNSNAITVQGGSAQAVGLWANSIASGASFASIAKADASISSTNENITITTENDLVVRGGEALASPQTASADSLGLNLGSASATAIGNIRASGITNITTANGGITWSGGGSIQSDLSSSESLFSSTTANITGQQLNIDTNSLYINSDGDIALPTSAVFVIGNGTQSAASGDQYLMNALTRNLLDIPETSTPNLKIVSSGNIELDADITLTGTHPYAWFIANSTSIGSLGYSNANSATVQYTPYSKTANIGVNNISSITPTSTATGSNYYSDAHFSFMNNLPGANIIIGSGNFNGSIKVGEATAPDLQNMNIGLLSTARNGVSGTGSILTNGKIFTLWSSSFNTDTIIPITSEFLNLDNSDQTTENEKKSRNKSKREPLIKISTYNM